ncbi:hypothetical protein [Natrinema halophilum]|uniref:Uncharacterized protein n=1 Tax=Natrinema halophilum TaxID=1699371 RepID=A0A7D5KKZ5_9EURY|nr:hypothetical protein [Natrinema halophilum]QLG49478.1 hypothetical protein HYG82_11700 [Natrinema halophilum]
MYGPVQFAGYVALLLTPATLLLAAVRSPPAVPTELAPLQFGIVLTGTVIAASERRRLSSLDAAGFDRTDVVDVGTVGIGAVSTYLLSTNLGFGPILASALVGLVVGLSFPQIDGPAYCGSFVGMVSPAVFPSLEGVAIAGTVAGLAFVSTAKSFGGFGGKYGTIALFGCIVTVSLTGADYATGSPLAPSLAPSIVVVAILAALATVGLRTRGGMSSVVASAAVGVSAVVLLPVLFGFLTGQGSTLAAVAFCASFVGMSSGERLETTAHVAGAGLLCGLVFLAVAPALTGAGGKLGTTAFVSCLALAGALELKAVVDSTVRRLYPSR